MGRYEREKADKPMTIAALMACATNIGLGRMAEISNLTRHQLNGTAANFIRLETLREANDRLANATSRLPIFRHFDFGHVVHSTGEGQKFEAAVPTFSARHSAKYFGLKKGVVAIVLLASQESLSARIIGANEHESHYVIDELFNNATDIQPDTYSTDSHGTNQVNCALLHLFGGLGENTRSGDRNRCNALVAIAPLSQDQSETEKNWNLSRHSDRSFLYRDCNFTAATSTTTQDDSHIARAAFILTTSTAFA